MQGLPQVGKVYTAGALLARTDSTDSTKLFFMPPPLQQAGRAPSCCWLPTQAGARSFFRHQLPRPGRSADRGFASGSSRGLDTGAPQPISEPEADGAARSLSGFQERTTRVPQAVLVLPRYPAGHASLVASVRATNRPCKPVPSNSAGALRHGCSSPFIQTPFILLVHFVGRPASCRPGQPGLT